MLSSTHQCIVVPKLNPGDSGGRIDWVLSHQWRIKVMVKNLIESSICSNSVVYLPAEYAFEGMEENIRLYYQHLHLGHLANECSKYGRVIINPVRNYTTIDKAMIPRLISTFPAAGVIAINVNGDIDPCETAILDDSGKLCGFRRFYNSYAVRRLTQTSWPDYLLMKNDVLSQLPKDADLAGSFSDLWKQIEAVTTKPVTVSVAGQVTSLSSSEAVLALGVMAVENMPTHQLANTGLDLQTSLKLKDPSVRVFGTVMAGPDVTVEKDCILIGPTIIGNKCHIGQGSLIESSVIDDQTMIEKGSRLQNTFVSRTSVSCQFKPERYTPVQMGKAMTASPWAYSNRPKRLFDITGAAALLLVCAPVMPLLAVAIKIESPGPVFFKHRRQGINGKEFACLKFRTMVPQADDMQDVLRTMNEVDGPQFKMENDPRVSRVGKFMRDTYLDELPQLFNVLAGQMSMVGPRPSPVRENLYCPPWHDARLSVRPGITGLWQVKRNPERTHDFQEWLKYDTEYVNNIGLKLDVSICLQTARKFFRKIVPFAASHKLPKSTNEKK